jgi:hypothetical protein
VHIYTYSSQYEDAGRAKEINKIGKEVFAACQGKLVAFHFGHASHSFVSPCPRSFIFNARLHLVRALLYTEKQEINKYVTESWKLSVALQGIQ